MSVHMPIRMYIWKCLARRQRAMRRRTFSLGRFSGKKHGKLLAREFFRATAATRVGHGLVVVVVVVVVGPLPEIYAKAASTLRLPIETLAGRIISAGLRNY